MHSDEDGERDGDNGHKDRDTGSLTVLRAQVEELRKQLGDKEQRTSEFVARLAHELRTPLGAILMWAHVLRLGRDADRDAAIDAIESSAHAESRIIGRLLDVTRGLAGRLKINRATVDLGEAVRLAVEGHRRDAEARGVSLETGIDDPRICVHGDADRIREVVSNLVSNGIKFTPSGGEVRVSLTEVGRHARIIVRDTGPGLAGADGVDVFEPFRMVRDADVRTGVGLGLGLALARLIVDLHGGTIRADSPEPGKGATFTVDLPLVPSGP